jgi:hypothetical protein
MNVTHWTRVIPVAALVVAAAVACSDSTSTAPVDDFLPIISNTWHDRLDDTHTFSLSSNDDSTASGTFTGEEDHPALGISQLEGTFNHSQLTFTIHRNAGDMVYSGHFLQRDTMYVTSSEGALTIVR